MNKIFICIDIINTVLLGHFTKKKKKEILSKNTFQTKFSEKESEITWDAMA